MYTWQKLEVTRDGFAVYRKMPKRGYIAYLDENKNQRFRKEKKEERETRILQERDLRDELSRAADPGAPRKRPRPEEEGLTMDVDPVTP